MSYRRTLPLLAALATVALAACGSDSESTGETTTTFPASTTSSSTTSTVAGSVAGSEVPTTAAAATTLAPTTTAAPTTTVPAGPALYTQVDAPHLPPGHTAPVPASGVLPDGIYWVAYDGGEQDLPAITVFQTFFGDECIAKAAEVGDECNNDYFVWGDSARMIDDLPFASDVYLTVSDVSTMLSHWISPAELVQIRAGSPSAGAPGGYGYVPFAFMMTVSGGEIVGFEQIWTP